MGTSASTGGPRGPFPLLPPWAQGQDGADGPGVDGDTPTPTPVPAGSETAGIGNQAPSQPSPSPQAAPSATPGLGNLRGAKAALSRAAAAGGGPRIRSAARSYVVGRGGSRAAARSAVSGRRATQRLGGFLAGLAAGGVRGVAESLRLETLLGRPVEAVLAVIANAIAPSGATLEEAAARRAVDDALCLLCERAGVQDYDLAGLDAVDAETVRDVLQASVAGYIYHRWLQEVGDRIERRSVSADAAVDLERQVRQFVSETVRVDFADIDVLRFDWAGPRASELVERIYRDAYSLLEE